MSRGVPQLVAIERDGSILTCKSPYHPAFVTRANEIHGRYDGEAWLFAAEKEDRVRAICREIYGTDGSGEVPLVSMQISIGAIRLTGRPDFFLAGRRIAYRPERDAREIGRASCRERV